MNETTTLICAIVLSCVLPVSTLVLYAVIKNHIQLAPGSAMHSAVTHRFDNEAERAAFHADLHAAVQARRTEALSRYRLAMETHLVRMDPREAAPYRLALAHTHTTSASASAGAGVSTNSTAKDPGTEVGIAQWDTPFPVAPRLNGHDGTLPSH